MTNNHPNGRDGNAVPQGCECPSCGEDDADRLAWIDDERVRCQGCGTVYVPGRRDEGA
jgi:rubredoxin